MRDTHEVGKATHDSTPVSETSKQLTLPSIRSPQQQLHDHGNDHDHDHDTPSRGHTASQSQVKQKQLSEIDLGQVGFCHSMEEIRKQFLETVEDNKLTDYLSSVQQQMATITNGVGFVGTVVSLVSSVIELKTVLSSEQSDASKRSEAHKKVTDAITAYQKSKGELGELSPERQKELLAIAEQAETALQRFQEMANECRQGAHQTNEQFQTCPGLDSSGRCQLQSQQNTEQYLKDIDSVSEQVSELLAQRKIISEDSELSGEERAKKLAAIDVELGRLQERLNSHTEEFRQRETDVAEHSELTEGRLSQFIDELRHGWDETDKAVRAYYEAFTEQLHEWASDVLGDCYQCYLDYKEELLAKQQSTGKIYVDEEEKRQAVLEPHHTAQPEQSFYVMTEVAGTDVYSADEEFNTTAERVERDLSIWIRMRRFIRLIQRHVIPMPFERDWREDTELREERRGTEDVNTLQQKDLLTGVAGGLPKHIGEELVTGLDGRVPQHERLTAIASRVLKDVKPGKT